MSCFFKTQLERQLFQWITETVDHDENGIVFEGLNLSEETAEWFAEVSFQIDAIKAGIPMSAVHDFLEYDALGIK